MSQKDQKQNIHEELNGEECSNCNAIPENIIFLGCQHAVCLSCVSDIQLSSSPTPDFSEFKCLLCGELTEFSPDIQNSLQALAEKESHKTEESDNSQFTETGNDALVCKTHLGEEFTMFNSKKNLLYCNQCLLDERLEQGDISSVKPLKKCLPEIFQNFQDMLNQADVCKNIIENRFKNYEILKENSRNQSQVLLKRFEIAADGLISQLVEQKERLLAGLEKRTEQLVEELEAKETDYNAKIDYFNSLSSELAELNEEPDNAQEDVLGFYFGNRERIAEAIEKQDEKKEKQEEQALFNRIDTTIKTEFENSLSLYYKEVSTRLRRETTKLNKETEVKKENDEKRFMDSFCGESKMYESMARLAEQHPKPDYSRFLNQIRDQSMSKNDRSLSRDLNDSRNIEKRGKKMKKSNFGIKSSTNIVRQTMNKQDYNIQKKLEIDRKLRNFGVKKPKGGRSVKRGKKPKGRMDSFDVKYENLQSKIRMRALKTKNENVAKTCFNFY